MEQEKRNGYFTSSQMSRLCASLKNGKPSQAFYTYIEEVKGEIAMGRSSDVQVNTKPLKYGSLMEIILFQKEEIERDYRMAHKLTIKHSHIEHYSGTPDFILPGIKVAEVKCFYPKHFASISLDLLKKDIEIIKENHKEVYWQVVSNSILCDVDKAEIIVFMPYKDELEQIILDIQETNLLEGNNLDPSDYYFMTHDPIETLPYLPRESKLNNINRFEFIVPQEDKELLISRVKEAVELLNT